MRAKLENVDFYSCYAPPSLNMEEFIDLIDRLVEDARERSPVVVFPNTGDAPTYQRDGRTSIVDLTIASSSLARQNSKWKVNNVFNLNDHRVIYCITGRILTWWGSSEFPYYNMYLRI